MKLPLLAALSLFVEMNVTEAQTTTPPAGANSQVIRQGRPGRPADQPDPNAPVTKYSYTETFAPFFYTKNGTEYRAATGEPGPKYWQNRADYQLDAKLNDETNEITASEIVTYTNNSPLMEKSIPTNQSRITPPAPW